MATLRLTKLIIDDYLVDDVRQWILNKFPENKKLQYFFTCPWCVSVWVATGLLILQRVYPTAHKELVTMLALSATTGIIFNKI
jgi:hypothetical protein